MTNIQRYILLAPVLVLVVGAIYYLESKKATPAVNLGDTGVAINKTTEEEQVGAENMSGEVSRVKGEENIRSSSKYMTLKEKARKYPVARELAGIAGYINTDEFKLVDLIGKKVILLDIWTYSCINCQRTLPYINSWYDKYGEQGLEIVGVHTPEFGFEKVYENVKRAVEQYGIKYPVVLDNDYATWNAYGNRYWPRKYLIDIDGYVVYDHIGEGGYAETEKVIQKLLEERAAKLGVSANVDVEISKFDNGAPESGGNSPEIYFGASRNSYLGNGESGQTGVQTLAEPTGIKTHILYLVGSWNFSPEFAANQIAGDKIVYRYVARNVFFVGGSSNGVVAEVLRDGQSLSQQIVGEDIYFEGGKSFVKISEERLYSLVKQAAQEEHTLEIIPQGEGLMAFTFTFG